MQRRTILTTLGLILALAFGWGVRGRLGAVAAKAKPAAQSATAEEPDQVSAEPTRYRGLVLSEVATAQPAGVTDEGRKGDAAPSPAKPADPVGERRPPSDDERRTYAAAIFETESFDRGWAVDAQRTVQGKLDSIKQRDVAVSAIDCRSSLCRLELRSDSSHSLQSYLRNMVRTNVGAGMAVPGKADKAAEGYTTVYLVRPGHDLPEMPVDEAP